MANKNTWRAWQFEKDLWVAGGVVSVADRGFRYGMSVFETVSVRNGNILFSEEHLARLLGAIEQLNWKADKAWSKAIRDLFSSERLEDGVVRLFITAGEGSILDSPTEHCLYALWEAIPFPDQADIARGLNVCSVKQNGTSVFPGMKTGNYWNHIHALQEAKHRKADECLIFGPEGELISAAMANVFIYRKGKWMTPPLETGARNGVLREWFLKHGEGVEGAVSRKDIESAEEIILVNSRIGVMPVHSVDGAILPGMQRGQKLAAVYLDEVVNA
ncbi:MAG: aminotransferase class IV [Chthoniobacterales bacterium]